MAQQQAGRLDYTSGKPMSGSLEVCPPPKANYTESELLALFPNSVLQGIPNGFPIDQQTGRVLKSTLDSYINNLQKDDGPMPVHKQHVDGENTGSITINEKNMRATVDSDSSIFNSFRAEYCHYEQRYRYALKNFLQFATSRDAKTNAAAQRMLQHTKTLNMRLNSLLEIMNSLTQKRVGEVNMNTQQINKSNEEINRAMERLKNTYAKLSKDNSILITQKEMVRYTQEKNNYTANQISLWAALNVLALGTIFYVYRN